MERSEGTRRYIDSGEYEGEYNKSMCQAAYIEEEPCATDAISHECDREEGHEEAHRCFCGNEF